MYPASFAYAAPDSIDEVIRLLRDYEDAKVLAGGCSLIPLLKFRLAEIAILVDLRHAVGGQIELRDGELHIGAMTREADLERSPIVARILPLLAETSAWIADPVVRNMGTVGGNLAHADPANDHPAAMLAVDASVIAAGPDGVRRIPIDTFFRDLYETSLAPAEIVTGIVVPLPPPCSGGAYEKLERQVGDFAIVGVAAQLTLTDGTIAAARIGLTNVGPTTVRASATEALLLAREPTREVLREAAAAVIEGIEPWDELRGSAGYKRDVLPAIARRALERAIARAEASTEGASTDGRGASA
jgi:aerobic carbon-monoxide dehydrogenase medium subunit